MNIGTYPFGSEIWLKTPLATTDWKGEIVIWQQTNENTMKKADKKHELSRL